MASLHDMGTRGKREVPPHWIRMVIAANLKARMGELEIGAETLGRNAKVGRRSVNRILGGENTSIDTLGAVADALGIDPASLMIPKREPMLRGSTPRTHEIVRNSISSARRTKGRKDKG